MPRETKTGLLDDLIRLLVRAPAWLGPLLAVAVFVSLRHLAPMLLPRLDGTIPVGEMLARMLPSIAWVAVGLVLAAWIAAEIAKLRQRRLLDRQQNLDTIRALTWRQFEQLVAEAYRRRGYRVELVDRPASDGGVDVVLRDDRGRWLVQCKHYKARRVGVRPVRELLGVVASEGAAGGIVVTAGSFTPDAQAFARDNAIELVDGPALADLVQEPRDRTDEPATTAAEPTPAPAASADDAATSPACPACGSAMVRRTARRGDHAGSAFWGCSTFPKCRGTRPLPDGATAAV